MGQNVLRKNILSPRPRGIRGRNLLDYRKRQISMPTAAGQIESLLQQLRENSRQAELMFASNTTGQLQHHPGQGRWSAAECIAHLNLSNRAYLPLLDSVIEQLREKKVSGSGLPAASRAIAQSSFRPLQSK